MIINRIRLFLILYSFYQRKLSPLRGRHTRKCRQSSHMVDIAKFVFDSSNYWIFFYVYVLSFSFAFKDLFCLFRAIWDQRLFIKHYIHTYHIFHNLVIRMFFTLSIETAFSLLLLLFSLFILMIIKVCAYKLNAI